MQVTGDFDRLQGLGQGTGHCGGSIKLRLAVLLDVEAVSADTVQAGEGGGEFLSEIVGEALSLAPAEPVAHATPLAANVDRVR